MCKYNLTYTLVSANREIDRETSKIARLIQNSYKTVRFHNNSIINCRILSTNATPPKKNQKTKKKQKTNPKPNKQT